MFAIRADTAEQMRDATVKWLNQMASNHRIAAVKIGGVKRRELELARASCYEGSANFLAGVKIESLS